MRRPRTPQAVSPIEAFQAEEAERVARAGLGTVDIRAITRRSDSCLTTVTVHLDWQTRLRWLVFGEAQIQRLKRNFLLKAYLPAGVTDFEHDSAYALRLPLVGLELDDLLVNYQQTHLVAFVDPSEPKDFRVPRAGYDPLKMDGTVTCSHGECKKSPHLIVPEGHYAGPPFDRELYEAVRGKRVEIVAGPAPSKKDSEDG